jgi:signal transduction histidine kinase
VSDTIVAGTRNEGPDVGDRRGGWRRQQDQILAALHPLLDPHVVVRALRDDEGQVGDFVCVEANEAAIVHLRLDRERLVGAQILEFLPGDTAKETRDLLARTLETGQPLLLEDIEYPFDMLEPERRFDIRVIRVGKDLSCTWCDVTERHEIEASLRRRVRELDAMHRIFQLLAMRTDLGLALDAARREIADLFGARSAAVCLQPDENAEAATTCEACEIVGDEVAPEEAALVVSALSCEQPVAGECSGDDPCQLMAVPMVTRSRIVGVLTIARPHEAAPFTTREITVAQSVADGLAAAVENERLHQRETRQAATDERQRLARDLHDSATQTIYSANLIAEILPASWQRGPEEGLQDTKTLRRLMRTALCEMRTLLYELRPETLDSAPLGDLLERLGEALTGQGETACEVEVDEDVKLPVDVKLVFYRVAQEALTNAAKHAHATRVRVAVAGEAKAVRLTVHDDGVGFDPAAARPGSMGLRTMRERAQGIDAGLRVESHAGEGTTVTMMWKGPGAATSHAEREDHGADT